jgi:hypothetical protein
MGPYEGPFRISKVIAPSIYEVSNLEGKFRGVLLAVHLDIIVFKKANLMHNLFLVYFDNLYMFRAYLGPSSGGKTVCIQKSVIIILFRLLSMSWLDYHLKRKINANC